MTMAEPGSNAPASHDKERPLGAYAALTALFGAGLFGLLAWSTSRQRLPGRVSAADTLLIGLATHKLSRIAAKEPIAATLRAPFTEEARARSGKVKEVARGTGLRRALGELVTCPYCLAPWIAGGLLAGYTVSRPAARFVATLFSTVAVSDLANHAYLTLVVAEKVVADAAHRSAPPEPAIASE
jgi:hypothetical protein